MLGSGGRVVAGRYDQASPPQQLQRSLDRALRQPGGFGERAQTHWHWFPFHARGPGVETDISEIRRGLLVVADDVAHQGLEHVVVDGNGLAKTGHQKVTSDM